MAMRSQVYEWSNIVDTASNASTTRRLGGRFGAHIAANTPTSIFIGGVGNNITKPASTSATQFVVIEDLACSPHLGMSVQVSINTTDYFQTPDTQTKYADGTYAGIPGLASPYPKGATSPAAATAAPTSITVGHNSAVRSSFNLYPSIYVLPGQTWDVKASLDTTNGVLAAVTTGVTTSTSDASTANEFTSNSHGLAAGDEIYISASSGTTAPDAGYYNVHSIGTNVFGISTEQDASDIALDSDEEITYHENGDAVAAFVKYTLYDGPDALIANKLLEMGVTVNPNNVDWYKRTLIEQGGVA
tara:strand:- start:53 stop:958 length:906 start_codon:yes stop_codon:yes gene_type:complete